MGFTGYSRQIKEILRGSLKDDSQRTKEILEENCVGVTKHTQRTHSG